jgi:hypothetical protein
MSSSHCLLCRMRLMAPATGSSIHAKAHGAAQPGLDGGHLLLPGGHGGRVREVGMRHQRLVQWSVRNLVKMLSAVPGSGLPARGRTAGSLRIPRRVACSAPLCADLISMAGGGRRPHLLARSQRLNPTPTTTPTTTLATRLHGATSQSSIQSSLARCRHQRGARRPPPGVGSEHGVSLHLELVGAAQAGVGTDMVPGGLLPRSRCCSLARYHRRSSRHRQTRGSRGCCYCAGSAFSPSPPYPRWRHASPPSPPSAVQTGAPPTSSRHLRTTMGTVRGELIDSSQFGMGEWDKPRRLMRRCRGR